MHILQVRFRTNTEFREAYLSEYETGGLFCPTTTPIPEGAAIICEVNAPALPNKVLIRGTVRSWRPALPRLRVRAGAMVQFDPDEKDKRDFLLETASGDRTDVPRRRHVRIPVDVSARWRTEDQPSFTEGEVTEISVGGALLCTSTPIPIGADVILELTPPGAVKPIAISGVVGYHAGQRTGIKFHYRDGGGSRRLRELVRRIRAS